MPGSHRTRLACIIAVVSVVAIGTTLSVLRAVRAQVHRMACLVPGLGIRSCEAAGLVARAPASTSQYGATMTVSQLLSSGGATLVQLQIAGLQSPGRAPLGSGPNRAPEEPSVLLRDSTGKVYQGRSRFWMQRPSGSTWTLSTEWTFPGLDSATRDVQVQVMGPQPIGSWTVHVPLNPVQQAGLAVAQEQSSQMSKRRITVGVLNVARDSEHTAVQVRTQALSPGTVIRNLGANLAGENVVLRDDRGRTYMEAPARSPAPAKFGISGTYEDDLLFPALPGDVRTATVEVPAVRVEEPTAAVTIHIPIAGRHAGDHISLNQTYNLGQYSFRVNGADIVEELGVERLRVQLDFGGWHDGHILAGPGGVSSKQIDGRRFRIQHDPDTGQWTELSMPLPSPGTAVVEVTFQDAAVAVQGPWQLSVTVPPSSHEDAS